MNKIARIPNKGLRVTALKVKNLWGIAEATIRPGQRNIIRGANGTGKTSLLNAMQLALGGGTLGKYARLGAEEEPEIVLEISGPADFLRVERKGDAAPKVLRRVGNSEAFERVGSPATFLRGLFDTKASNPFAFLGASDDERAQLLLEALDLEMDEGALAAILGDDAGLASSVPTSLHPLVRLALTHDAVYMARRGCNVEADAKKKSAEQLKRSVPFEKTSDLTGEIGDLEAKVEALSNTISVGEREAKAEADATALRIKTEYEARSSEEAHEQEQFAAALRAETEKRIAERLEQMLARLKDGRELGAISLSAAQALAAKKLDALARDSDTLVGERERLAALRERHLESARHDNTRKQIAEFEQKAEAHEADSERLTSVLNRLEELKRQLASRLPIEGLDISGKEIRVSGIPWADLNKAQQATIAGVVAVERARRSFLPVVFFDEAEHFDGEHLKVIADIVENAGAQLFAAVVVNEGELTVDADGAPAGEVRLDAPKDAVTGKAQ